MKIEILYKIFIDKWKILSTKPLPNKLNMRLDSMRNCLRKFSYSFLFSTKKQENKHSNRYFGYLYNAKRFIKTLFYHKASAIKYQLQKDIITKPQKKVNIVSHKYQSYLTNAYLKKTYSFFQICRSTIKNQPERLLSAFFTPITFLLVTSRIETLFSNITPQGEAFGDKSWKV